MKALFCCRGDQWLGKLKTVSIIKLTVLIMLFCSVSFAAKEGAFQCPASPNCVSTEADANDQQHYVKPFKTVNGDEETWVKIRQVVLSLPRINIIREDQYYLKAKVKTPVFRFVDDLDILFSPETKTLSVKSASNVGYSDLGVNRKRVEHLRALLTEQNILLTEP